jgi:hypothetical protein
MPNLNLSYIYRRHFTFLKFGAFNPLKFQRMIKRAKNLVFLKKFRWGKKQSLCILKSDLLKKIRKNLYQIVKNQTLEDQ